MTRDNALKRALIPVLKALTKAIQVYTGWAVKHRKLSNMVVGMVLLSCVTLVFWIFVAMIAIAFTKAGIFLGLLLLLVLAYIAGSDINNG